MARNSKQTSARAASAASKVLRDGRTSKASKTAAGSALAQRPPKTTIYHTSVKMALKYMSTYL